MTDTTRLNKIIEETGLKKKFLAQKLGLTPYGLAKKINGETEFKASEITKICQILDIQDIQDKWSIFFANKVD